MKKETRKLASIQKIWKIEPIEGADRIELAYVLGWKCIVNKGVFKQYDLAVYFEIDSFLPVREEFEFLRTSSYKKNKDMGEGFRLKTIRLRGQISQGLLIACDVFPELYEQDIRLGNDVTQLLGVRQWDEEPEKEVFKDESIIGRLPDSIPKTDEIRIQSQPDLIEEFEGLEYYISTKMDGSSHSVGIDKDGFHVTTHNYEIRDDDKFPFRKVVKRLNLEEKMSRYNREHGIEEFVIQGELCGPNIQKNRLLLKDFEWYVFTVRINGRRVGLDKMLEVCTELGLSSVPVEETGVDLPSKYPTVDDLLKRADGNYPNGGKKEGIVIRPKEPVYSEKIRRPLSMKIINNNYLLKNED